MRKGLYEKIFRLILDGSEIDVRENNPRKYSV